MGMLRVFTRLRYKGRPGDFLRDIGFMLILFCIILSILKFKQQSDSSYTINLTQLNQKELVLQDMIEDGTRLAHDMKANPSLHFHTTKGMTQLEYLKELAATGVIDQSSLQAQTMHIQSAEPMDWKVSEVVHFAPGREMPLYNYRDILLQIKDDLATLSK